MSIIVINITTFDIIFIERDKQRERVMLWFKTDYIDNVESSLKLIYQDGGRRDFSLRRNTWCVFTTDDCILE